MNSILSQAGSQDIVIFGGAGDLSFRKLLPALYMAHLHDKLQADTRIVAIGRQPWSRDEYLNFIDSHSPAFIEKNAFSSSDWQGFLSRLTYVSMDVTSAADYAKLKDVCANPALRVFYLATAPSLFTQICANLSGAGLVDAQARVVLEKPLGTDLASARAINTEVARYFDEQQIYRIDHYLGKETVQNLMVLRFGNAIFEPLWRAPYIKSVQITVAETVGVGSRAGFYDGAGAMRDMVQNHMLQLLALVAMEPPASFDATSIRDEKVKVLRSLRDLRSGDSVTGQYRAGAINGAAVPGYDEELGRASDTETFVALRAHVDNWRWKGVPFYLRTGKRLPERKTEIVIQFKAVPHSIFAKQGAKAEPNRLIIGIQPQENIRLSVMAKSPGLDRGGVRLREVPLDISMPNAFAGAKRRIAYERLLLDLIEGDQTLFVRRDEVEAQWHWIDAIRAGWAENGLDPKTYTAGSWGPSSAIALVERDGVTWHD